MISRVKYYLYRRLRTSFAKSGEDIQLWQMLGMPGAGLYADIGCHHPVRGSNSFFFHLRGWKGICVDPNPSLAQLYRKMRPGDLFLNQGVSEREGEFTYYHFGESRSNLNTLSKEYASSLNLPVSSSTTVPVTTLAAIFTEHLKDHETVDFLTVDCEGFDEKVIRGNDWHRFRPRVLCIETHSPLAEDQRSPLTRFLGEQGYELAGKSILGPRAPGVGSLFFLRGEGLA